MLESSIHGKDVPTLAEEIGMVCYRCDVLNGIFAKSIDMMNVDDIADESHHSCWARFPNES